MGMRTRTKTGAMSYIRDLIGVAVVVGTVVMATTVTALGVERKPLEVTGFTLQTVEREGVPYDFTQAGGHPWGLALTYQFSTEEVHTLSSDAIVPTQDVKDLVTDLPPGLLGNPNPRFFPRCPLTFFLAKQARCPTDTQVGVVRLRWFGGHKESIAPLVSLTPEKGQSAEFGIETASNARSIATGHVVRVGDSYGLTIVANNVPTVDLIEVEVTVWGVPADPSHDAMRGKECEERAICESTSGAESGLPPMPFVTMPADCTASDLAARASVDSWEEPGHFVSRATQLPPATGCQFLRFTPELEVRPDRLLADEPVGLGVTLRVPQAESPTVPGTPQVRDTIVTLPDGLSISPGIVDGIRACPESGLEGINFEGPLSEEPGLSGELQLAPGRCPDASTVGTAKAFSPLLDEPVEGHVYLAEPGCGGAGQDPCTEQDALDGNLYRLYLELGGVGPLADTGVNLKVRGKVEANPTTGQLTSVFENTPQLPFSKLEIHLNGGPRAPLDNPWYCGLATTTGKLTPWSAPGFLEGVAVPGTPDGVVSSSYEVDGCSSSRSFAPGFLAGNVSSQAAKFSTFTMSLSRRDREQFVKGLQLHTPPGLLGVLSSVALCPDGQADAGACTAASRIGSVRVASGAGSHPFELDGVVYLSGPYNGAPFGLSIVVPVVAGPFNLGIQVVRARIDIDPMTSALTVTADETGPFAVPQIVFGVPVRLKRITVYIDRPNFMFNPTNCEAHAITAAVVGDQNALAHVSTRFVATACKTLAFKPRFIVTTVGKTSRVQGASIDAKLTYPPDALGNDANVAKVRVSLPRQLPSRLTTLQKACPAATFDADPAACPSASVVGMARALTPLLPVMSPHPVGCPAKKGCKALPTSVVGPVYFVSHGGEAFPNLVIVLQGDGVRVDLKGDTFISKSGITSSTFKTVPDVPVSSFELYLPQGPNSALAANGNLCSATTTTSVKRRVMQHAGGHLIRRTVTIHLRRKATLSMPTEFIAQNGTILKKNTTISVTGCKRTSGGKRK